MAQVWASMGLDARPIALAGLAPREPRKTRISRADHLDAHLAPCFYGLAKNILPTLLH